MAAVLRLIIFSTVLYVSVASTPARLHEHSFNHRTPSASPVPIIIWHGMGDNCCSSGMNSIVKALQNNITGVYVQSIELGDTPDEDSSNSYFAVVNKQIDAVCTNLSKVPQLQNGYHAIGFSQGAQFLRAVAQRCAYPPMINLISIGGQHQGVNALPNCGSDSATCDIVRNLLDLGAYTSFVQNRLVQAQYWHDSLKEETYRQKSIFLADINNENTKNPAYKANLQKLRNFVMVRFLKDTMVYPQESEWFGYYCPGSVKKICTLKNSALYTEDWLGLKVMDQSGKLAFLSVDGDHLQFTLQWFLDNIAATYLH